jgi:fructoselysine-6-P-deglycase FrlB-like protein
MLPEELLEQPRLWRTLLERPQWQSESSALSLQKPQYLLGIGEGSSFNALMMATPLLASMLPAHSLQSFKPWQFESWLRVQTVDRLRSSVCLPVSQSGKTASLHLAWNALKGKMEAVGLPPAYAFTNAEDNYHWNTITPNVFNILAGEEKAICATKSFSSTVLALTLWALQHSYILPEEAKKALYQRAYQFSYEAEAWLEELPHVHALQMAVAALVQEEGLYSGFCLLSRGVVTAALPEFCLKLQESTRHWVTWDHSESFKHGPMALCAPAKELPPPCLLYFVPTETSEAELLYEDAKVHYRAWQNAQQTRNYQGPPPLMVWFRLETAPSLPAELQALALAEVVCPVSASSQGGVLQEQLMLLLTVQHLCLCLSQHWALSSAGLSKYVGG